MSLKLGGPLLRANTKVELHKYENEEEEEEQEEDTTYSAGREEGRKGDLSSGA